MANLEFTGMISDKSHAPSTSDSRASDVASKLQAEGNPQATSIMKAAAIQPYLPTLDPICSQPLPKLEIGDDLMDHRMAIGNFLYRQKLAGCFKPLQS